MPPMATKILTFPTHDNFESDCREIHDSLSGGLGHLLHVLVRRSRLEILQIRGTYREMYGEDLAQRLQQSDSNAVELYTEARRALMLFLLDPYERDAVLACKAIKQDETNYGVLVEIFTGRKSSHIELIKRAYLAKFRRHLDQDIVNIEPPHPFQRILGALATSHKAHEVDASQHIAKCDARRLYETGEGQSGGGAVEEAVVLEILSKRSILQLKYTLSSYWHIYGHDYSESLKRGSSSEFEDALYMVVKCIMNSTDYFAEKLYQCIEGKSRDKGALIRVMVSRAEVDLNAIQSFFKRKYGIELKDSIAKSIPPGDYRDFLVALATKPTSSAPSTELD
ncbi:hypothetical protein CDL15_Pgr001311 [Punica granatum]|uniref:Annexin D8-like n=2 Tax=Punica granatum TaxID=22663 RepID=A0A218WK37_PUNGR|nr:hypothetical protein CDL15_Pgr001311 [Punica granatum]